MDGYAINWNIYICCMKVLGELPTRIPHSAWWGYLRLLTHTNTRQCLRWVVLAYIHISSSLYMYIRFSLRKKKKTDQHKHWAVLVNSWDKWKVDYTSKQGSYYFRGLEAYDAPKKLYIIFLYWGACTVFWAAKLILYKCYFLLTFLMISLQISADVFQNFNSLNINLLATVTF